MSDTINTIELPQTAVDVSISWTPASSYTFTAASGLTITAPSAPQGVGLTFVANVAIDHQGDDVSGPVTIVEYRWDFGDGVIGYGSPTSHTYLIPNLQTQTTLRVTDSRGRQWFSRAQMYLTPAVLPILQLPLLLNMITGPPPLPGPPSPPSGSAFLPLLLNIQP